MAFCVPESSLHPTIKSCDVSIFSFSSNQSQSSIVLEPLTRLSSKVSIIYTRGKSHLYEARHCKKFIVQSAVKQATVN